MYDELVGSSNTSEIVFEKVYEAPFVPDILNDIVLVDPTVMIDPLEFLITKYINPPLKLD